MLLRSAEVDSSYAIARSKVTLVIARSEVTFVIARSEATWQSQPFFMRLLRFARNDTGTGVIAPLPVVARNDTGTGVIAVLPAVARNDTVIVLVK